MTAMCFWFMACAGYFPRGCRDRVQSALQEIRVEKPAALTTIIGPLYSSVCKRRQSDTPKTKQKLASGQLETGKTGIFEVPPPRPKRSEKSDSVVIADLKQLLGDKKNEKKYKLSYTAKDDIFLNQTKASLLKLDSIDSKSSNISQPNDQTCTTTDKISFEDRKSILQSRKKTSLNRIMQLLDQELDQQRKETDANLRLLSKKIELDMNKELFFEGTYQPEGLLKDMQCRFEDEIHFLDHMEYKQQNMVVNNILDNQRKKDKFIFPEKERPKKSEDYVCQVCSDGDYTESNQIVFCARCNISFHQRCYGIEEVPDGNWICDLCKYHGPSGRFMRCAFCTRRGGCLRRTEVPARSDYWKQRNPSYYQIMVAHPVSEAEPPALYNNGEAIISDNVSVNSHNFESFLYYDYYKELDKVKEDQDNIEPHPYLAWVHLSCCLWNSELEYTVDLPPKKIIGFDRVDRRRFGLECNLCGCKEGACVQCVSRKCHEAFHVECARRVKMFMEIKNSDSRHYTIYCDRHAPLMAKRKLDSTSLSICNDITKFSKHTEKYYDSYRYKFEDKPLEEETPAFIRALKKKKIEKSEVETLEERLSKNFFLREVRHELVKFPDFGNVITIRNDSDGIPDRAEYEPSKKKFLKSAVHKHHKVWSALAKKNNWVLRNVYKKFKRILQGSTEGPLEGLEKPKLIRRTKADWAASSDIYFVENTESRLTLLRIRR